MLNCQNCTTPCFDFEETGSCPIEANWAPVPCCPDEDDFDLAVSLFTCQTCEEKENCHFKKTGICTKEAK